MIDYKTDVKVGTTENMSWIPVVKNPRLLETKRKTGVEVSEVLGSRSLDQVSFPDALVRFGES